MINIPSVPAPTGRVAGTQIYICQGIPWDRQYKHVRLFGSKSAALSFCQSKSVYSTTSAKPVRNNSVKVPLFQDTVLDNCNYILYNNTQLEDFWVMGFITGTSYVSDNCTEIMFEVDVFQTYFYNCTLSKCYVKRHHWDRSEDTIGANTLPEPVQAGYYRFYNNETFNFGIKGGIIDTAVIMYISDKDSLEAALEPKLIGNVFSGLYYYWGEATDVAERVKSIVNQGKAQGIVSIQMCPDFCFNNKQEILGLPWETAYGSLPEWKNKKMYTYPYCYVDVRLNGAGSFKLNYEMASDNEINVGIRGSVAPYPEVIVYASTYDRNITRNLKYSLVFNSFPQCAVANDSFAQYMNGNIIKIGLSSLAAVGGIAAGAVTKNPAGAIGGISSLVNTVGDIAQAQRIPDTTIGTMGSGGSLYSANELQVRAVQMGWDENSAKAADDFMSIYGYATNNVVTPNLNSRNLWNYVETADCNVQGDVAYNVRETLNNIFNSGVFVWHTNAIGNFNIGGNG